MPHDANSGPQSQPYMYCALRTKLRTVQRSHLSDSGPCPSGMKPEAKWPAAVEEVFAPRPPIMGESSMAAFQASMRALPVSRALWKVILRTLSPSGPSPYLEKRADFELVRDEHVVRLAKRHAIEVYLGDGVEALEEQHGVRGRSAVGMKGRFVHPVRVVDPLRAPRSAMRSNGFWMMPAVCKSTCTWPGTLAVNQGNAVFGDDPAGRISQKSANRHSEGG